MQKFLSLFLLSLTASAVIHAEEPPVLLTTTHGDIRIAYDAASGTLTNLVIRDGDAAHTYQAEKAILVVAEEAKLTLPPGTPFGEGGDPLWVLPASQDPSLLYLGISGEGIPGGTFSGAFTLHLKSVQGPGDFFVWQAGQVGGLQVLFNSADGISTADQMAVISGSHGHYNWGFTTSGVYQVTFQAEGRKTGQSTNLLSPETTFTFHVLPLPIVEQTPFELWQQTNWPGVTDTNTIGAEADPDGDGLRNLLEYALGLNPKENLVTGLPQGLVITNNAIRYGALRFTRAKAATDITYQVEATSSLTNPAWTPISMEYSAIDNGDTEQVTLRDFEALSSHTTRFYRLRLELE